MDMILVMLEAALMISTGSMALEVASISSSMGTALVMPEVASLISGRSVALEVISLISNQSSREVLACMALELISLASSRSMTLVTSKR